MPQLESLIRLGYALVIVSMLLMIWASMARAREIEAIKYPPCTFNPLCTCSKPAPDLGILQCRNVPFPAIPRTVNNSKVFMLHMENTGLRELEPHFLQATGLYRLELTHNPLTEIPDEAFTGLERSLWELLLHHNELIDVPTRAVRHLQKLRHLDLSGNQISCIELDSFRGLEDSLQTLILAENSLLSLPPDSFSSLPNLETIDLSGNNLVEIDPNIFRDGMPRLSKLLLADNMLSEIPYTTIGLLKNLRTLDLSQNVIKSVQQDGNMYEQGPVQQKLTLDTIHLEFNLIEMLPTGGFEHFDVVNTTFLDGNPLRELEGEAFRGTKMRELYIRFCGLTFISTNAFLGMGSTLQVLDLSGNNITSLSDNLLKTFDDFRMLNLRDNKLKSFTAFEIFNGFQLTLQKFDVSGSSNTAINLQELRRMRNIRSLSLSRLSNPNLSPEDFMEFGVELEDLKITHGPLQSIKSHTFKHVRGIKRLDLSENDIGSIENDAFLEIGHSLNSLKISHGLSPTLSTFPAQAFRSLTSLAELDMSNNHLKSISDTSFHFLKNLKTLEMHDNSIDNILKGTFQGDIHSKLQTISFGFNGLRQIQQHTFVDLEVLNKLLLNDNRITKIERRAFMNLDQLRQLNLRGNKLDTISDESFQVSRKE